MKFILFNINDTNKNYINKIDIDSKHYVKEVSLSKYMLEKLEQKPKSFVQKLKYKILDKDIDKKILKALESHDKKWYYILSNRIENTKYLTNKAQELLGYKQTYINELDNNIFMYVDEYLSKNTSLKKHEVKVLLVVTNNKNLNFSLVSNLIKEYKDVDIYLKEKTSTYILNKIKQINKEEGTSIDIVKKERKVFSEYNIIYFADDEKGNYPRFRFNKEAFVLDLSTSKQDKFNSNNLFINKYLTKQDVLVDNIKNLMKEYKSQELAIVIRKIVNNLDKS